MASLILYTASYSGRMNAPTLKIIENLADMRLITLRLSFGHLPGHHSPETLRFELFYHICVKHPEGHG